MDLHVALDGSKRRDITLFQGDEVTLNLIVHAQDGDTAALAPTDVRFADPEEGGFAYGSEFVVSEDSVGSHWYRLVGEVDGVTTTLAFGYLIVQGNSAGWCGCPPDGYWISP